MGGEVVRHRVGVRRRVSALVVDAETDQAGDVHLRTNLRRIDTCLLPAVFGALAEHVGLDAVVMEKAAKTLKEGPPDPRYPELSVLIASARRDWLKWGDQLIAAIGELLEAGKLYPMNPANEYLLNELFADHEVKIIARFAGHDADLPRYQRLVKDGHVSPGLASASYIDVAWKLGRGLDALQAHALRTAGAPALSAIVKEAVSLTLTPKEEQALDYATRRAAIYMRRPAEMATSAAHRVLNEAENGVVRAAVGQAVTERRSWKELAPALREAVTGHPTLLNDMDRVARTELAFAHSHGAYVGLKEQAAAAGHKDPQVYKFVSPRACTDCKRIWGPPANPRRYALSEIEAREAAGGNFGLSHKEWGPVIGPVHPHCTEGPLQFWDAALVDSINKTAEDLLAHWFGG